MTAQEIVNLRVEGKTCPTHNVALLGRVVNVRTGLYMVLRRTMLMGECPYRDCDYSLDITNMGYEIVV